MFERIREIIQADSEDLVELARIAGLDIQLFYRGSNLSGIDLTGQDLRGVDFTGASLEEAIADEATQVDEVFENQLTRLTEPDLLVQFLEKGDQSIVSGSLRQAMAFYTKGFAIAERLTAADPGNAGWQRDLALSYGRTALVQSQIGDAGDALQGLRHGRQIVADLRDRAPGLAVLSSDLAWLDKLIEEIDNTS